MLVLLAGHVLLPVVPCGGEGHVHVADAEALADVVSRRARYVLLVACHLCNVMGCMNLACLVLDSGKGLAGEVVVVDVGVEQCVKGGHVLGKDGRLHEDGHVEAYEQGIAEDGGTAAVEQEACVAEPVDGGLVGWAKGLLGKGYRLPGHCLAVCAAANLYAHVCLLWS